jgi:hypothetical protein
MFTELDMSIIVIFIIILTANEFVPGGSGTHKITDITQNNTPHLNKTQHTK